MKLTKEAIEELKRIHLKVYGYEKAPHEIEARNWTSANVEDAIKKVIEREKSLQKKDNEI